MLQVYAQTDVGKIRKNNEDSFLAIDESNDRGLKLDAIREITPDVSTTLLLMVSDGMGGAAAGEVASMLAVKTVAACITGPLKPLATTEAVEAALQAANQAILTHIEKHPKTRGMGATATLAAMNGNRVCIGQVGDSRAYLLRDGTIRQLTRDQSFVNQLVESGKITEEEALVHPRRNIILQALGSEDIMDVVITELTLLDNDLLLLCTDGLTEMLRNEELHQTVVNAENLEIACQHLVETANKRGGNDNITVVLAKWQDVTPQS